MVNKPFWHINDFVLASYTFGCVNISDFLPNNRHLWEVLISSFHSKNGDFDVDDRPREERPKFFEDADVIYYKQLKSNETNTGERYRTQLMRLSRVLREKRPQYEQSHEKVILQHDNARSRVAKPVKTYLETFKKEVLPHPPYSPDIAPSDYYLFRSMAHGLADQQFLSHEDIEKWLGAWIASKDEHFYRNSIRALPERWAKNVAITMGNTLNESFVIIFSQ